MLDFRIFVLILQEGNLFLLCLFLFLRRVVLFFYARIFFFFLVLLIVCIITGFVRLRTELALGVGLKKKKKPSVCFPK